MSKTESFNPSNHSNNRISHFHDEDDDEDNSVNSIDSKDKYNKKNNLEKSHPRPKGDNEFYGIVNLMASAIGGGCMTFPSLLQTSGVVTSFLIFIFVSICIYFSLELLRSFILTTHLYSLAEITSKLLGQKWLKIYVFCAIIFYLSVEINYINLIVEYGAKGLFSLEENDTYYLILFYCALCLIEIILCLFTSKVSHIHILSLFSVFCFIFFVIVLIIYSSKLLMTEEIKNKFSLDKLFMPSYGSLLQYITSICTCFIQYVYAYSCHSSFPTLIGNLETQKEKTNRVVNIFFASTTILYIIIALFGYISQINTEEKIIFLFTEDIFNKIFLIAIIIFFICLIPIRYIVIRDSYLSIFPFDISYKIELLFIALNMILANIISYFCSGDTNIIFSINEIFGGVFGVVICFVLPVITYISINNKAKCKSIFGYIMAIFFLLVGLFTAGYSFCEKN